MDSVNNFLRWSHCQLNDELLLPPPPDFSIDVSQEFVTSTQIHEELNSPDLIVSPPKKKLQHGKLTKQEALDFMSKATNHTNAAQNILEVLAERTFSDISGKDLQELERAQDNLRRKLERLGKDVKSAKFRYKQSKVHIN